MLDLDHARQVIRRTVGDEVKPDDLAAQPRQLWCRHDRLGRLPAPLVPSGHPLRMNVSDGLPSTRRLDLLPAPGELRTRCVAIALIEGALNTDRRTRWHLIERDGAGDVTCRVDDGSGNQALYWFGTPGSVLRGFDHESPLTPWARDPMTLWPGLYDGLPTELEAAPTIVSVGVESVTFCIWRESQDNEWRTGSVEPPPSVHADPDGSEFLLQPISSAAEAQRFLEEYYEVVVDLGVVTALFEFTPLTSALLARIGTTRDEKEVLEEASAIDYPIA